MQIDLKVKADVGQPGPDRDPSGSGLPQKSMPGADRQRGSGVKQKIAGAGKAVRCPLIP